MINFYVHFGKDGTNKVITETEKGNYAVKELVEVTAESIDLIKKYKACELVNIDGTIQHRDGMRSQPSFKHIHQRKIDVSIGFLMGLCGAISALAAYVFL